MPPLVLGVQGLALAAPTLFPTQQEHMFTTLPVVLLAFSADIPIRPPSDVLLQARVASLDKEKFAVWLQRRGFAAVLPIQPMLVQPLEEPLCGLQLTFRRKPNSEKGGQDGGLRFTLSDNAPELDDGEGPGDDSDGLLLVTRISEGQYVEKLLSERRILQKVVADLERLPDDCGSVLSVVNVLAK